MKQVKLSLPDELHRRLKVAAAERGTTMQALLLAGAEAILAQGVQANPPPPRE